MSLHQHPYLSFPSRPSWAPILLSLSLALSGIASAISSTVVISQVYGGGGNSGATYTHDYVELKNVSTSAVSLAGWSLQYGSGANTNWSGNVALSGSIAPGGYFLVMLGTSANVGVALPTPDLTNTTVNMSGTSGKVALVNNNTALTTASFTGTAPTGASIVDFIGYGTSVPYYEGIGRAPAPSVTLAAFRAGSGNTDTDANSLDFATGAALPRNSSTAVFPADTVPPVYVPATLIPADGATNVGVAAPLSISFNEAIQKGTGNITVHLTSTDAAVATIPVASTTVAGQTASIPLPGALAGSTEYYINVANGTFKDAANNNFTGISGTSAWNFTTAVVDNTPPELTSTNPLDGATGFHPVSNLVMTYNESLLAGSGVIQLTKADSTPIETIAVPGPRVTVSGTTVTIDPSAPLDFNTSYYVEVSAGAVTDNALNPNPLITGTTDWNFTTRTAPAVEISQYYEGTGSNRFIELKNLTASPVLLTNYRLTVWSDTAPSDNEGWKAGNLTTDREISLATYTIPANGYLLVANSTAAAPTYAVTSADLKGTGTDPATFISGDDSVVLYDGATNALDNVADAVSLAGSSGTDISFYRLNDAIGYDFNIGSSILNYAASWTTRSLADVATATPGDAWYLKASQDVKFLQLSFNINTFSEAAGNGAATATVTRTGSTVGELLVNVSSSDETEVTVSTPVTIPDGQPSTTFALNAINDSLPDGSRIVTITAQEDAFVSATAQVTVTDDGLDPAIEVVINEMDVDQLNTDTSEFIELYNKSSSPQSLDGLVLVLYNGNVAGDASYDVIDLSGHSIPPLDYFVIGSASVLNVDLVEFTTDGIQNGGGAAANADAVALCIGNIADFPNGNTAASVTSLLDAVVYNTGIGADPDLVTALTPGKPQLNENVNTAVNTQSLARVPNGGAAFDTTLFVAQAPTPGATNILATDFESWVSATGATGGMTGDTDLDGRDNAFEYAFGLSPTSGGSVNPFTSILNKTTGEFTFTRRNPALTGLTYTYEYHTTLTGAWTPFTPAVTPVSNNGNPVEAVTVTVPAALLTEPKLFIRIVTP